MLSDMSSILKTMSPARYARGSLGSRLLISFDTSSFVLRIFCLGGSLA